MTTITNLLRTPHASGKLRPFDVRRDLSRVADLVEQCFADTLDPDGQHYLGQMRAAAHNPAYLRLAGAAAERVPLPLSGYVWEEDGQIVGNLTLIPYHRPGKRYYLIANVAVRPDYRRRGIARSLTARAIEHSRRRGADSVWLHVRAENQGAIRLYQSLGFTERSRRTTWHSSRGNGFVQEGPPEEAIRLPAEPRITISPRPAAHWPAQRVWLDRLYPPDLAWHLSINQTLLSPGLVSGLYRFFTDARVRQWSASHNGRLLGVLSLQSTPAYADSLWLATRPEDEELAAKALLLFISRHNSRRRPLALDYPADQAGQAIQEAGFHPHQTLIWMTIKLSPGTS